MLGTQPIEGESWVRWLHEIRRIEFERMMARIPLRHQATALEVGSGDGFQLSLLRQRFERAFGIDPERRSAAEGFSHAVAEALPFPDQTFDLVVSCCVVEHMTDRKLATEEAVRVLRPSGYLAHAVPTPFWKATSLVLNPVGYPVRVLEKWCTWRRALREKAADPATGTHPSSRPGMLEVLGRVFYPPIHGTYTSHRAELRSYARNRWLEAFRHPALQPIAEVPLLSYTQFGLLRFRLRSLRVGLAEGGFASSRAYIFRKVQ